jgi:hypothetical protein
MTGYMLLQAIGMAAGPVPTPAPDLTDLLSGTFSNEEQAYFEKDAGRPAPPRISFQITQNEDKLVLQPIDAFGKNTGKAETIIVSADENRSALKIGNCSRFFDRSDNGWVFGTVQNRMACQQKPQIMAIAPDAIRLRLTDGSETILKRAREVQCWAAVPKKEPKEDGSTDWLFVQKLALHDQGGRVTVGGGDSGAEAVTLKMRAVHWPAPSTNRPSMVLYVHKGDPDHAESYSWADIDASRVGINLRWMQASCTIAGAERESEVNADNFRG